MFLDGSIHQLPDIDPTETSEWLDSLDSVVDSRGKSRAHYLLARLMERARDKGVSVPLMVQTDYINTIPREQEPWFPGDEFVERRIRAFIRWNAVMMVDRANHRFDGLGGHLSTYVSAAALYEVGFNHFFRGKSDGGYGDQVFFQGHAAPGIYARAYLEGRLTDDQLDHFRREVGGHGLPSYPHPRRLPDFWEFPTVSMGLGPIAAVYQARLNRYLYNRHLVDTSKARVWCFVGDGEMDEPEATAALRLAAREQLDNLIFVVNCNLQRLDGPVRGNGKVIQEFESMFRGMGWNVIKVIWGGAWDDLLARDVDGVLVNKMNSTLDGDFQKYAVESGAYIREHFFGPDPRLRKMVEGVTDEELQKLPRGGHDYRKLYAAYKTAIEHEGAPTVILAKTLKGWTLGRDFEGRNATHQIKKMTVDELKTFRDRLYLDIPDEALESGEPPYYHPGYRSPEYEYLMERRRALDGFLPDRVERSKTIVFPRDEVIDQLTAGTGEKVQASTTMAFTRLLRVLLKDPEFGPRVVPIIPDEARTFGMDAAVRRVQDLFAPRSAVRAGRCRADAVVPGGGQRTVARGGHHRGRRDGVVHGGVHRLRNVGLSAHPVLHLLFHVRLPAGRRPDLGLRRPTRQGFSARRDRRTHDADRRRAATLRRAVTALRDGRSQLPCVRPGVRVRSRRARARRHPAHVRRRRRQG